MQALVKSAVLFLLTWTFLISTAMAENKYVSEDFEITLRTGPGTDRKIISLIPSGQSLEIVTPGEEWTEVTTHSGKQGWVLTRYLTDRVPTALKLERLKLNYDKMQSDYSELKQKATALEETNKRLNAELGQTQTDLGQLSNAHESLKSESADFLKLKKQYESAVKELKEVRTKAQSSESELNQLIGNQLNEGLLYGGGLLVLGMIIGFVLKRPKRRAPLM
jgi:SH3 domain protein